MTAPTVATRLLGAATLAMICFMILVAFPIGPVLATLTETHGIHQGDLMTIPLGALALWLAVPAVIQSLGWNRYSSLMTAPSRG